jgi:hypothetical protein
MQTVNFNGQPAGEYPAPNAVTAKFPKGTEESICIGTG